MGYLLFIFIRVVLQRLFVFGLSQPEIKQNQTDGERNDTFRIIVDNKYDNTSTNPYNA